MTKDDVTKNTELKRVMEVEIGFPECVHIELVQSNELKHYEIFMWLSSLFTSAAVGFLVALASIPFSKILLAVSIVFTIFAIIFGWFAFSYRSKMNGGKIKKIIKVEDFK